MIIPNKRVDSIEIKCNLLQQKPGCAVCTMQSATIWLGVKNNGNKMGASSSKKCNNGNLTVHN